MLDTTRAGATCIASVIALMTFQPASAAPQNGGAATYTVGATERQFQPDGEYNWRGAAVTVLLTHIWYPVDVGTPTSEHVIGPTGSPWFRLGRWTEGTKPAAGHFPLIVLSHGTGGSAQIMAWLAAGLASRGFVVAAVNHPGNNALQPYTPEGFLLWWERARDMSTVLDMLLRDPAIAAMVDPQRIGAAGFSLGGYTVLKLVGARTDPALFRAFCRSPAAEGCGSPPEFPDLIERWEELQSKDAGFQAAVKEARASYRDGRVVAAFAIAPALGQALVPATLADISAPVAIVAGESDRVVPINTNARFLARSILGASLTLLPSAGHYTFLASCTEAGRIAQPQLCADTDEVNRDAVHQRTVELADHFFRTALR